MIATESTTPDPHTELAAWGRPISTLYSTIHSNPELRSQNDLPVFPLDVLSDREMRIIVHDQRNCPLVDIDSKIDYLCNLILRLAISILAWQLMFYSVLLGGLVRTHNVFPSARNTSICCVHNI